LLSEREYSQDGDEKILPGQSMEVREMFRADKRIALF
jgi:hypothetical protein